MENVYMTAIIYSIVLTITLLTSCIICITLLSKKVKRYKKDLIISETIISDIKLKLKEFYNEFNKNYSELNNSAYCINNMLKEIRKKLDKFLENYPIDYNPITSEKKEDEVNIIGQKYKPKDLENIFDTEEINIKNNSQYVTMKDVKQSKHIVFKENKND